MRSHLTPTDSIRAIRLRGDRLMTSVCVGLWFVTLLLAPLYSTWVVWATCSSFLVLVPALLTALIPGTRGSRIGIGLCLMGFPAISIHQTHGMVEAHFGYFLVLSLLVYYRDWRPILASSCLVAFCHLFLGWLQLNGYPVFFFPPGHDLRIGFVDWAYVTVEAAILIFLALTIRLEALESSAIAAFGERISRTGTFDLTFDSERHKGSAARGLTSLLAALQSVTSHSAALAARIDSVSENIAASSSRILGVVQTKIKIVREVSHSVESMSEAGARIKAECAAVAQVAGHSAAIVTEGCATMRQTAELMLTVSQTATSTVAEIDELHSESARIESIVRIMNDLSNQSSLLALNASIEAARAGEIGKGFQVVAQEIRTLSERSYQSLAEVQLIVEAIGLRVAQLHAHAHRCQSAATEGGTQVKAAHAALTEVAQHLPQVAQRANRVVETADQHTSLSAEVLSGMTRIGDAILQNSTEMQNFATLCQSLEEVSEELSSSVSQFHTQPPQMDAVVHAPWKAIPALPGA